MALLTALAFTPIITANAESAAREVSVYLYRDYADCVFLVSWENAKQNAVVKIKDPDGAEIETNERNAEYRKGGMSVSVGPAKSGYWTVYVTGESLGAINISGGSKSSAAQYNAVRSFDAEASGGYINFKWDVTAERDTVNVTINAAGFGDYGSRAVWNDYSASGRGAASVSADELLTGLYSFSIQVYDGNEQYTLSADEPIYVKQSNAPAKLEGVKVGSIDGEMFAVWDARANNSYMVTLYDRETLAVIKTERTDSNFYQIALADEIDKVKFSAAEDGGSAYGEFDVYEIVRSAPAGRIVFPDYSSTRESLVAVKVDCPIDTTAGIYLDGTLVLDDASAGDYDLNLSEGAHEVVAFVKDTNGSMKTFSKSITVDKTPPVVNLNNPDSVTTAAGSLVIEGSTEPNAVVAINGVEQELGLGGFMAKLALENGVNPISVAAYDLAGNKSVKTITAERTNALGDWTVYVAPGAAFILLAAWYAFLNKKVKGAKPDEKAD
ncbi:MAG: hypothetical protein LBK41_08500 [Clostridiales bacterium]|nr:hypothetical protein [Clostridiales bacterium]